MWQYTTETIINENVGNLPGDKRFGIYSASGSNSVPKASSITGDDFLIIDGVTSLKLKNIKAIYVTPYEAATNATAKITLPYSSSITVGSTTYAYPASGVTVAGSIKGQILRLEVKMHEVGQSSSIFQNAYLRHQKPFHFEIESSGLVDNDIAKFEEVINKTLGLSDFKFFTANIDSTYNNILHLVAADCYCQFDSVRIDLIGGTKAASEKGGWEDYTEVVAVPSTDITIGSEGNGTVARLLKNLRVPTSANTNPFGPDTGGKPIPGGKYDQYTIEYVTDRRHVGNQVMGSVGDQSMTTHVLFVAGSGSGLDTLSSVTAASPASAQLLNLLATYSSSTYSKQTYLTGVDTFEVPSGKTGANVSSGTLTKKTPENIGSVE